MSHKSISLAFPVTNPLATWTVLMHQRQFTVVCLLHDSASEMSLTELQKKMDEDDLKPRLNEEQIRRLKANFDRYVRKEDALLPENLVSQGSFLDLLDLSLVVKEAEETPETVALSRLMLFPSVTSTFAARESH